MKPLVACAVLLAIACGGVSPTGTLGRGFVANGPTPTCASGQKWTLGNAESAAMNPGLACRGCHLQQEPGKAYFFMGTAYSAPHEEDLCAADAVPSDAVIEILDTNDVVQLTLPINAAGNFYSRSTRANVPVPYKARVRANGKVNPMGAAQSEGDCNSCHTAAGANGAPGRIFFPPAQ
jgi:hypothetical protein